MWKNHQIMMIVIIFIDYRFFFPVLLYIIFTINLWGEKLIVQRNIKGKKSGKEKIRKKELLFKINLIKMWSKKGGGGGAWKWMSLYSVWPSSLLSVYDHI